MTNKKAKEKKTRKPWGQGRIPLLNHWMGVCKALGIDKYDQEKVWAVLLEQVQRDPNTFLKKERKFHKGYNNILSMRPGGQSAVLTQFERMWGGKKIKKRRAPQAKSKKPKPPPPPKSSPPPPPPPNAVASRPVPPPPPNAVEASSSPSIGDQLSETWNDVFGETIPPIPEKTGQSIGTLYGEDEGKEVEVHGHDKRVCISIKFQLPGDQEKVVSAVQDGLNDLEPFGAVLMDTKHSRRPDGFWVDLLIHYSVEVVDLYKSVLSCDLVLDAEANPADAFGKTAQNAEALD